MKALTTNLVPTIKRLLAIPNASPGWFWNAVLFPFIVTRSIWELVGYFAYGNFTVHGGYERYIERGYFLTRHFPLDMFARYDAYWYFSIVRDGYQPSADLTLQYSNLAFFPLYPYLVKSLGWLGLDLPNAYFVLVGLLLSNILFIGAMALLYRLIIVELGLREEAAKRAVGLIFVFPASFYFASFYTESLFLFLALMGFTLALKEKWFWTGVMAALAVLSRSQGAVLLLTLFWLYMEKRQWRWREIRPSVGWFALAPLALLAHSYHLFLISGHVLAIFDAVRAWGRFGVYSLSDPFRNLQGQSLDVFKIDFVLILLFFACGIYIAWKWPYKAYGVFVLLMCALPVYTGLLISVSRYLAIIFPVFILLGEKLTNRNAYDALRAVWFALQIVYFAGWVNFYWVA